MPAPDDVEELRALGDAAILRAALELEEEAVGRYTEQGLHTADPRLYAYWEALRRNEEGHRGDLRTLIDSFERGATTA